MVRRLGAGVLLDFIQVRWTLQAHSLPSPLRANAMGITRYYTQDDVSPEKNWNCEAQPAEID